jgi:hypothetical protein
VLFVFNLPTITSFVLSVVICKVIYFSNSFVSNTKAHAGLTEHVIRFYQLKFRKSTAQDINYVSRSGTTCIFLNRKARRKRPQLSFSLLLVLPCDNYVLITCKMISAVA